MTDKNGDDDKGKKREKVFVLNYRDGDCVFEPDSLYDRAVTKVALGNLFIQREIEQARDEHTRVVAMLENLQVKLDKIPVSKPSLKLSTPPATATLLLAFIAPKNTVQAFLGDLEEVFHRNAACFGERQARRQYWMQVFASLGRCCGSGSSVWVSLQFLLTTFARNSASKNQNSSWLDVGMSAGDQAKFAAPNETSCAVARSVRRAPIPRRQLDPVNIRRDHGQSRL